MESTNKVKSVNEALKKAKKSGKLKQSTILNELTRTYVQETSLQ